MKNVGEKIRKKCLLWLMVMLMLTGTAVCYEETVQAETTVYVTRTGAKYHTHKCGNGNYYSSSLSDAKARGLEPCLKCFGSGGYGYGNGGSSDRSGAKTQKKQKAIKLNKTSLDMIKGQKATLKLSNGSGSVRWSSNDSSVVSVSSKGKLTAKKKGKATITVKSGSQKKQCKVTVEEPKLNKTKLTMDFGGTKTLKLSGCKHSVKWSSSDSNVVKVNNGKLTAKSAGKATIKAKVHGKSYSCKVTVGKPTVKSIKLGAYDPKMEISDFQEIEITTNPSSAIEYHEVSVVSSDPSVVTVSDVVEDWEGVVVELVSGNAPGKSVITVSIDGKTKSFTIEVVDDTLE